VRRDRTRDPAALARCAESRAARVLTCAFPVHRAAYEAAGAKVVRASEAFAADLVCKVRATTEAELALMRPKSTLVRRAPQPATSCQQRCAAAHLHHPRRRLLKRCRAALTPLRCALPCSFVYPAQNAALMKQFEARQLTVLALDAVPRTLSRSQAFDALSSQGACCCCYAVLRLLELIL
jgi:NAD/NADP transhydrogenase alpha subunit